MVRASWTALLLIAAISGSEAQNLNNSGRILNSGTINIRQAANGLPDTLAGTMNLFGSDQNLPARTYQDLQLAGSGLKTAEGNVRVMNDLSIAPAVTLNIPSTFVVDMGGRLTEQGILSGSIRKSEVLAGPSDSTDFGGIGLSAQSVGIPIGPLTVTRTSGTALTVGSSQTIERLYDISGVADSARPAITFTYRTDELNGQDPATLTLWRSSDGGLTWRKNRSLSVPADQLVQEQSVFTLGRWALADDANPLGPDIIEGSPVTIAEVQGNGQRQPPLQFLDTAFVVRLTDGYDQPIPGDVVTFVIDSIPADAAGYVLTTITDTTNADGEASTLLMLGDKAGTYRVTAQSASLGDSIVFLATARARATSLAIGSGNNQSAPVKTVVSMPLVVNLLNGTEPADPGIAVHFRIVDRPDGAVGDSLLTNDAVTDAGGQASTLLRLGTKTGWYRVETFSAEVDSAARDTFDILAVHGTAAVFAATDTVRVDTVLNAVAPLAVTVTDDESNAVPNSIVRFAVTSSPATNYILGSDSVLTDSLGWATVPFTLGDKVGVYEITATSAEPSLSANARRFLVTAQAGTAARLLAIDGDGQRDTINAVLPVPLRVRVTDAYGNPRAGIPVVYTVADSQTGSVGHGLTSLADTTDNDGLSETGFILGSKTGAYRVRASSPALPSADTVFTLSARPGRPAIVARTSGEGQRGQIGDRMAPFTFRLADRAANAVDGDTVSFGIVDRPANSTGDSLLASSAISDSAGSVSTTLVLGSRPGRYAVEVVAGSLRDTMGAEAIFILADANRDNFQNIGDLTALVDHVLGRQVLTGYEFIKADVNADGIVDIRDILATRDSLLLAGWDPTYNYGIFITIGEDSGGVADIAEGNPPATVAGVRTTLALTRIGVRLMLNNEQPVRGLQAVLYLKNDVALDTADLVFPRASMMTVDVASSGREVRLLVYNLNNEPIASDSGAILRLPLRLTDLSQIDSMKILVSVDSNRTSVVPTDTVNIAPMLPASWRLYQNYPNPFNASTTIMFDVPEVTYGVPRVAVQIFNLLGQKVRTIYRENTDAQFGVKVVWDGRNEYGQQVASGPYFYRLLAGEFTTAKKMVMVK